MKKPMTTTRHIPQSPLMTITWRTLERAKDAGDEMVIAACRRLIEANRLGIREYARLEDKRLVLAFDEAAD